jgi:hypothetical protein
MATAYRRLEIPSQHVVKAVSSVVAEYLTSNKLVLSPSYQRARCWKRSQNCGLIRSIMLNYPIPGITLYKLHPTNPDDTAAYAAGYRWECVDGQNRLHALLAFSTETSLPNDKGVEETVVWQSPIGEKTIGTLTEEERDQFDSYNLTICIIQSPMTLAERKDMFTLHQDGTRISRAEYIKNSQHPVSLFVSRHALRDHFLSAANGLLGSAKGDWIDIMADWVTLYTRSRDGYSPDDILASLDRNQTTLRKILKAKEAPPMTGPYAIPVTEDDYVPLLSLFNEQLFPAMAAAHGDKIKCHKFHILMLCYHFLVNDGTSIRPEILRKWFKKFGTPQIKKKQAEEEKDVLIMRWLYDELQRISSMSDSDSDAPVKPKRRAIPSRKRYEVWSKYFGSGGEGKCQCCDTPILFTRWELGHIEAVATGGSNDPANLLPVCGECNRSCGAEDLRKFCVREYPKGPFASSLPAAGGAGRA